MPYKYSCYTWKLLCWLSKSQKGKGTCHRPNSSPPGAPTPGQCGENWAWTEAHFEAPSPEPPASKRSPQTFLPVPSTWENRHDITMATELTHSQTVSLCVVLRHLRNPLGLPQTLTPTPAEGFWVCQGHRAFPFRIARAAWGIPAAQRVVISEAAMSVVKITYLPLRGEYSVYQLECVPAELITAQRSVSQWFVLSFIICVTQQCAGGGKGSPPSLFLYPFCVENLYLLWECNLFLMDNVTLSGAGSWVSWSDIFR